jgi:hypothetical protein
LLLNLKFEVTVLKKKTEILLAIIIISASFLNGCNQQNTDKNSTSSDVDLNNDNYHDGKMTIISDNITLKQNQGLGAMFTVDYNCKFVVINWEVTNPQNITEDEQQNIILELMYPPNISVDYSYDIVQNRNLNFTVNSSSLGNWSYGFLNSGVISNITITREIYLLK